MYPCKLCTGEFGLSSEIPDSEIQQFQKAMGKVTLKGGDSVLLAVGPNFDCAKLGVGLAGDLENLTEMNLNVKQSEQKSSFSEAVRERKPLHHPRPGNTIVGLGFGVWGLGFRV